MKRKCGLKTETRKVKLRDKTEKRKMKNVMKKVEVEMQQRNVKIKKLILNELREKCDIKKMGNEVKTQHENEWR